MERSLSAERLYSLAEFQNIKFVNTLTGIPREMAENEEIVRKFFYLQALSCDIAYVDYKRMREKAKEEKVTDILEFLKEERMQTLKELMNEITNMMEKDKLPERKPAKDIE